MITPHPAAHKPPAVQTRHAGSAQASLLIQDRLIIGIGEEGSVMLAEGGGLRLCHSSISVEHGGAVPEGFILYMRQGTGAGHLERTFRRCRQTVILADVALIMHITAFRRYGTVCKIFRTLNWCRCLQWGVSGVGADCLSNNAVRLHKGLLGKLSMDPLHDCLPEISGKGGFSLIQLI